MTTIQTTPYGAIYLTPDHLIDFSAGEARLAFDLSTLGASRANWVDVWITPYEDALQLPSDDERIWPSNRSNGNPRRALHLSMAFGKPDGIPGTDFRPRSSVTSNPARC
jgi:hypothetical protein